MVFSAIMRGHSSDCSGATGSGIVDIVLPVFQAADDLRRCLGSVAAHTATPPHRLVIVMDGPQGDEIEEILTEARNSFDSLEILRNPERRGFVVSVNRGMAVSERDVILLNSDTIVTSGWVDKLHAAAYSADDIATATPLSNDATLCSFPEAFRPNLLPAGYDPDSLAELVEGFSVRTYPSLPTGVGVCLFIKREALDSVGFFDEETFGLGYGEETDFCLRAAMAGYRHVLDDSTFIFHAGSMSFGRSSDKRRKKAWRILCRRHPAYPGVISQFMAEDPLEPAKAPILAALSKSSLGGPKPAVQRRILHVVHGWPPFNYGGTEIYAQRLAQDQAERHSVAVFCRINDDARRTGDEVAWVDGAIRCRLMVNNFDRRDPLARNAIRDRRFEAAFKTFAKTVRPDLIHVHHLSGHCATLMGVAAGLGVPVIYQVQDWWPRCARANLIQNDGVLCSGPEPGRCSRCLSLTELPPRWAFNRVLYLLRDKVLRRSLAHAHAYIMGSQAILDWYTLHGGLAPAVPAHVLSYGVPRSSGHNCRTGPSTLPLRFGVIGSIMPHKGVHVAVEAFRGLDQEQAELIIWGDTATQPAFTARIEEMAVGNSIRFAGVFSEQQRNEIFDSLDVLIVPSIGLESFGIVAREALAAGVPVLASRLGALAELSLDGLCGASLKPGSVEHLRGWVDRLIGDPSIIDGWRRSIPLQKTTAEHAAEIESVYDQVLSS